MAYSGGKNVPEPSPPGEAAPTPVLPEQFNELIIRLYTDIGHTTSFLRSVPDRSTGLRGHGLAFFGKSKRFLGLHQSG